MEMPKGVVVAEGPAPDLQVRAAWEEIKERGPNRVLVPCRGGGTEGVPSSRARRDHGIYPEVIFIRRDGWSLGATRKHEAEAFSMWRDEWSGFIRFGWSEPKPISVYEGRQ